MRSPRFFVDDGSGDGSDEAVVKANARATVIIAAFALGSHGRTAMGAPTAATSSATSTAMAFDYGAAPDPDLVAFFPRVVLDPQQVKGDAVRAIAARGTTALARLRCPNPLPGGAATATAGFRPLLDQVRALMGQGFSGFLLEPEGAWSAQGFAAFAHDVHAAWPTAPLYLEGNPDLAAGALGDLSGLVGGPLFAGWSSATRQYAPVPPAVREMRVAALQKFARTSGLPVIDVEAVPRSMSRADARKLAGQVDALGFVPWVAPAERARLGVGAIEAVPRRVLVVVDGAEEPYLPYTLAHRLLAVPLEYLGFAVDYVDVRSSGFDPATAVSERYAGIVTWFTDEEMPSPDSYERWLLHQIDAGVRVALLGHLGFVPSQGFLRRLGVTLPAHAPKLPLHIATVDEWMGFEATPVARGRDLAAYVVPSTFTRHLQVEDAEGQRFSPVFEGQWGGMALDPYLTESGFEGRQRWMIDPFRFLASALALPDIPVPDPTTENGRRLLEIHVDGDGFVSLAELPSHPLAGEVIRRDFLARYHLPTTVSIIEGEIGPQGLYPAQSPRLEAVARAIFALPEVEIASHTYSHPFDWLHAQGDNPHPGELQEVDAVDGDRLNIPGYQYSVVREVDGSVRYIDEHLAPAGKTTKVLLWSGNALPPEEALVRTDALGLANLNGDNAEQPGAALSLAGVPSFVRPVGARTQIYAPAQNENVYTNLWHGPFYGFRRVIDYFRFTDLPRRLKPIGIYYHFYSGTKAASVKALHEVYDWAVAENAFPVWASEYAARVRGFEQATLARRLDGSWLLRDFGALRTVRLPVALGWPDLERSPDVVGVRDLPQGRYVSLVADRAKAAALSPSVSPASSPASAGATGHSATRVLSLSSRAPTLPFVEAANAPVASFRRQGNELWFGLSGHVPVDVTIGGCSADQRLEVMASGGSSRRLRFSASESGEVHVICR